MTLRAVVLAAVAFVATGCIALPFATPPIEYAGSVGVAAGDGDVKLAVPVRATIYPAGLAPELYKRTWELGAGYSVLLPIDAPTYHGPYAEIGYYELFPIDQGPTPNMWRVGLRGAPTLVFRDSYDDPSIGASLRVTGEYVSFADGPLGECDVQGCVFGYAWGETSGGLYAEVSHYVIDDGVWTATAGILLRSPATAGLLFTWLVQ